MYFPTCVLLKMLEKDNACTLEVERDGEKDKLIDLFKQRFLPSK